MPATDPVFGQKLFKLRKDKGWSQPELAKRIGTSGAIIGRYERGEMTPSIDVARKLAGTFHVTVDFLVTGSSLPSSLGNREMLDRWEALDQINNEDRDRILFLVDGLIRDSRARMTYAPNA